MNGQAILKFGGIAAGVIMVVFGVGSLALGIRANNTVGTELKREAIVGSADMNPTDIKAAVTAAGLTNVPLPSCNVADKAITTGTDARCFAQYMRVHALESSGGNTYAQMGRFVAAADPTNPKGTSDDKAALKDDKGKPVANGPRNTWVTETALSTALNVLLHGGAARTVHHRGRARAAAQRCRLHHPRPRLLRWRLPQTCGS